MTLFVKLQFNIVQDPIFLQQLLAYSVKSLWKKEHRVVLPSDFQPPEMSELDSLDNGSFADILR